MVLYLLWLGLCQLEEVAVARGDGSRAQTAVKEEEEGKEMSNKQSTARNRYV